MEQSRPLRQRLEQMAVQSMHRPKHSSVLLYATGTLANCHPEELRRRCQAVTRAWAAFSKRIGPVMGWYRWLEVAVDQQQYNPHVHGILHVRNDGRHYRRSDYDWEDRWADAAGPLARSMHVEPVRTGEAVAGYVADMRKFLDLAELAETDPHRFIDRTRQMSGLHRYVRSGTLSLN